MTTQEKTQRRLLPRISGRGLLCMFKIGLMLAALGVVIWVYGGDVYVALALAIFTLAIFAHTVAPGAVPKLVGTLARVPLFLGAAIPLWAALSSLFPWNPLALRAAGIQAALYGLAVLVLLRLPRRMITPFANVLPPAYLPEDYTAPVFTGKPRRDKPARTASTAAKQPRRRLKLPGLPQRGNTARQEKSARQKQASRREKKSRQQRANRPAKQTRADRRAERAEEKARQKKKEEIARRLRQSKLGPGS